MVVEKQAMVEMVQVAERRRRSRRPDAARTRANGVRRRGRAAPHVRAEGMVKSSPERRRTDGSDIKTVMMKRARPTARTRRLARSPRGRVDVGSRALPERRRRRRDDEEDGEAADEDAPPYAVASGPCRCRAPSATGEMKATP